MAAPRRMEVGRVAPFSARTPMRYASLSLLLVLAISCDSGSDAPVTPTVSFEPTLAVTEDNALDFARVGMRAVFDLPNLAYIGASFLRQPVPQDPNAPSNPGTPVTLSAERAGPDGGTAVYSWEDIRVDNLFSTDDIITINFEDYADGDLTLNGIMIIDDLRTQGTVTQGGGTWLADATLRLLNLEVQLGAGTFILNEELPFRVENRELIEIFDLFLFEDLFLGEFEMKQNSRWLRYETDDELSYQVDGFAFSPELDGVVRFKTDSVVFVNTFSGNPTEGFVVVNGTPGTFIEVQSTSICSLPIPLPCTFDVRVEEDGEEGFETTLQITAPELLPQ